jgi:hypothetical protein
MKKTTVKEALHSLKIGQDVYVKVKVSSIEPNPETWTYEYPIEFCIQRAERETSIFFFSDLNDIILIPDTEPQTLPTFEPKIGVQCVCITETGERKVVTPTLYKGEVIYVDRFFVVVDNPASFQRLY